MGGWWLGFKEDMCDIAIGWVQQCVPQTPQMYAPFEEHRTLTWCVWPVLLQFEDICEAVEVCKSVRNPYRTILKRRYWPQLCMAVLIPIFQQLTGINAIM